MLNQGMNPIAGDVANGMMNAAFPGMQQLQQQQQPQQVSAAGSGGVPQGALGQPMMGGAGAVAVRGGGFNAEPQHQQQQQDQATFYLNAMQANQPQQQQQQGQPQQQLGQQQLGIIAATVGMTNQGGGMNTNQQAQAQAQGLLAQIQQQQQQNQACNNQDLASTPGRQQQQPQGGNRAQSQGQDSNQNHLLLQQQNLIAQLQHQLQNQQQGQQQQQPIQVPQKKSQLVIGQPAGGLGGGGQQQQQQMPSSNNLMQQQQQQNFGGNTYVVAGSQQNLNQASKINQSSQISAIQDLLLRQSKNNSNFGNTTNTGQQMPGQTNIGNGQIQQHQQQMNPQLQQLSNANNNNLPGQQQTPGNNTMSGQVSQKQLNQGNLQGFFVNSNNSGANQLAGQLQGQQQQSQNSLIGQLNTPNNNITNTMNLNITGAPAGTPGTQSILSASPLVDPNQHVMDALRRATSSASSTQLQQPVGGNSKSNADTQQQLLMAQLQQQISGGNSNATMGGGNNANQIVQTLQQQLQQQQQQQQAGNNSNGTVGVQQQQQPQIQSLLNTLNQQQQQQGAGSITQGLNQHANANAPGAPDPSAIGHMPLQQQRRTSRRDSHISLLGVAPDPIADAASQEPLPLPPDAANSSSNCSGKDGKQSYLDGNFEGGWQSNADLPDRRRIIFSVIKVIQRMRPDADRLSQNRLPLMAKKLEEHLYRSALTRDEYIDPSSLKRRLHQIAKGVGMLPLDDGDDPPAVTQESNSGQQAVSNTAAGNQNQQHVPLEAVSQGLINGLMNNPPQQQQFNQPQQAQPQQQLQQQQMLLLQSQGQQQLHQMQQHQLHQMQQQQLLQMQQQQLAGNNNSLQQQQQQQQPNNDVETNPDKKKAILLQQQRRLLLLRHASKCNVGLSCKTKFCPQMVTLWKHMKKCRDKHCKVPHCLSSRCVLNHYRLCKSEGNNANCPICAPVVKCINQDGDASGLNGNGMVSDDMGLADPLDAIGVPSPVEGMGAQNNGATGTQLLSALDASTFTLNSTISIPQAQQPIGIIQQQQSQGQQPNQDLQQELRKKQILLHQVQQQQENIFGQSQKLQQQFISASNPQQAQQLQKQQTILQQLIQQFGQQQSLLQNEIQRQSQVLENQQMQQQVQLANNQVVAKPPGNSQESSFKRWVDTISTNLEQNEGNDQSSQSNKRSKGGNGQSIQQNDSISRSGNSTEIPNGGGLAPDGSLSGVVSKMPPSSESRNSQLSPHLIAQKCGPMVQKLINHENGWVFKDPVDPVELGLPEYFDVVEHPMDLTLVANKLQYGAYPDVATFEKDTKLVFENAIAFNGEDSDVGGMAKELLDLFATDLKKSL